MNPLHVERMRGCAARCCARLGSDPKDLMRGWIGWSDPAEIVGPCARAAVPCSTRGHVRHRTAQYDRFRCAAAALGQERYRRRDGVAALTGGDLWRIDRRRAIVTAGTLLVGAAGG